MALTAYARLKFLWGAFEGSAGPDYPTYDTTYVVASIPATVYGMRAQLVFDRSTWSEDDIQTHLDFINYTSGSVDGTWTNTDFETLEGYLTTWWNAIKSLYSGNMKLREIRWYPFGPGIHAPNPAVRVTTLNIAGTSAGQTLPFQSCADITLKTGLRRRWGRMYLPPLTVPSLTEGKIVNATCDTLGTATGALVTSAASSDFVPVVWSPTTEAAYAVERVTVDNVFDVIRSRRQRSASYRKTLP